MTEKDIEWLNTEMMSELHWVGSSDVELIPHSPAHDALYGAENMSKHAYLDQGCVVIRVQGEEMDTEYKVELKEFNLISTEVVFSGDFRELRDTITKLSLDRLKWMETKKGIPIFYTPNVGLPCLATGIAHDFQMKNGKIAIRNYCYMLEM